MKWAILVGLALAGSVSAQTIYRCEVDGQLVFSQQPCADDAEKIEHDFPVVETEPAAPAQERGVLEAGNYADQVRIERRIDGHERQIRELQSARDRDIATLRQRMARANNNLAGAQYMESIATDMQAVTDRYESRIEVEQRQIDRLRDDLDRLRD